jgi:hypothetical protein
MMMEFCRFRDFAVPLLGLSTRHPSIHEMRATQLVDSSFRAPHLPDAAGTRLCLDGGFYDLFGTNAVSFSSARTIKRLLLLKSSSLLFQLAGK